LKKPTRWLGAFGASLVLLLGSAPAALAVTTGSAAAPSARPSVPTPAAASARSDAAAEPFGIPPSPARAAVERALDPGDYACSQSLLDAYVLRLMAAMSDEERSFLAANLEMLDIPANDALLSGTAGDPRYALRADYRHSLVKTFRDVKRFWDIQSSDIQLLAMHGSMLTDADRSARILDLMLGKTPAQAAAQARSIAAFVAGGAFDHGDNPLFTLNAFAFTAERGSDPLTEGLPDKLVFGDGIVDALGFLGIADVGPRAVMGHEFGHHVQYEDNLLDSPLSAPEATRRSELMADAFGTYFATHARGLSLNTKRVLQAERTFFAVGDCAFDDRNHHGTPNQRLRSATWAANLADTARPQGKILPSLRFAALFEQELPELVAPDR
jgi:hypothetical protein